MKENYLISVLGKQQVNGQSDEIEVNTTGTYVRKGDKRYIMYKEYGENSQPTRTNILKIEGNNRLTVMRGGTDGTHLILENGKRYLCQYNTGYGNLMLGISTSELQNLLTDKGGSLKVQYTLDINSSLASSNELYITVKEAESKDV